MSRALLRHGVPPKASGHSCVRDRFGQSPGTRSQHVLSATCSCVRFPFQRMKGRIPSDPRRLSGSPQRRCRALSVSAFCGAVISEPHGLISLGSSHGRGVLAGRRDGFALSWSRIAIQALPSSLTGWLRFLPSWERLSFPVFADGPKHVSPRLGQFSSASRCFHGLVRCVSPALRAGQRVKKLTDRGFFSLKSPVAFAVSAGCVRQWPYCIMPPAGMATYLSVPALYPWARRALPPRYRRSTPSRMPDFPGFAGPVAQMGRRLERTGRAWYNAIDSS